MTPLGCDGSRSHRLDPGRPQRGLIEMRRGGSAMPPSCFADTSGKRDISHNGPSPKSSPSESHPVAHLYHSKPPDGGSHIPKAKSTSHLADARGMNVCGASPLQNGKCNNSRTFYRAEFLAPRPRHDHPSSPFMFVGHSSDLLRAVPAPPRLWRLSKSPA